MDNLDLKVTNVRIKKFGKPNNNILGLASVLINNLLVIHDIRIVQLKDRRILSFPAKKVLNSTDTITGTKRFYTYEDIVHPTNSQFRKYLEDVIFKQFDITEEDQLSEQNY